MDQATLSQQVYEQLHRKLREGQLPPGTQLVNRTLAAEFGTSTIPVREAISRLVSEGVLDAGRGGGAFVRSPDVNELAELYDVREALEVLAATEATKLASESLLTELRTICEQFAVVAQAIPRGKHATRGQLARWLNAEEQFHTRLAVASRNRWLIKTLHDVRVFARIFAVQHLVPRLLTHAIAQQTARQHQEFLAILVQRDHQRAGEWMATHIRQGRETVLSRVTDELLRPKATKETT